MSARLAGELGTHGARLQKARSDGHYRLQLRWLDQAGFDGDLERDRMRDGLIERPGVSWTLIRTRNSNLGTD